MPRIDGAVLFGRLRLFAGWAAASFHRDVAIDLFQEWFSTIRHAFVNHAQRAALADRGAGGPILGNGFEAKVAQARRGALRCAATEGAKWITNRAAEEAHARVIGRTHARATGEGIETFLPAIFDPKVL